MNVPTSPFFLFVDVHCSEKHELQVATPTEVWPFLLLLQHALLKSKFQDHRFASITAFSTAKKELYLQYIRFKFSNNSIPTCPICCCLWHISRAACDFKKGHDQQQQQTFGWLDSGWLERCFESSSLSEQGIHWVEMRRFGFNFKLYSTCHACKWPLFPDPWSQ